MSREYPKANCNNCCKKDVCRYIEEKNKIGRELEEIINNQTILTMSLFCSFFQEEVGITRHFLNNLN
jgi:hypothetical protein